MSKPSAIVIGAGIVGLATARALLYKGFKVTVIEKNEKAVGASIRNFGMIWPIGQPDGKMYQRAMRSRTIWKDIADAIFLPYEESGSLHLAYHPDEWQVLQELHNAFTNEGREVRLITRDDIAKKFNGVNEKGLIGGLYSYSEMIVDPRAAIAAIPRFLCQNEVEFIWGKLVTGVQSNKVFLNKEVLQADLVFVCTGDDFKTLYPSEFLATGITRCRLQMMRFKSDDAKFRIRTSICGGLSLVHYKSFEVAASLPALRFRYHNEMPRYIENGIHVMVSQNSEGELTVGDSHHYGDVFEPFDSAGINELIIGYLKKFAHTDHWKLLQTWNGSYPKMPGGATDLVLQPDPGVYIINGLGGAGMTLSFGFTEEVIAAL